MIKQFSKLWYYKTIIQRVSVILGKIQWLEILHKVSAILTSNNGKMVHMQFVVIQEKIQWQEIVQRVSAILVKILMLKMLPE